MPKIADPAAVQPFMGIWTPVKREVRSIIARTHMPERAFKTSVLSVLRVLTAQIINISEKRLTRKIPLYFNMFIQKNSGQIQY